MPEPKNPRFTLPNLLPKHPLQIPDGGMYVTPLEQIPAATCNERRLAALRYLLSLYYLARFLFVPASFTVNKLEAEQIDAKHRRFLKLIDKGFSYLVKTGFDIPDHWLAVRPIGDLSGRVTNAADGKTHFVTLHEPKYAAVNKVMTDFEMAIRRLEIEPPAQAGGNGQAAVVKLTAENQRGNKKKSVKPDFLSVQEVADVCGKTKGRISQLCKAGKISYRGKGLKRKVSLVSAQTYFAKIAQKRTSKANATQARDARKDTRDIKKDAQGLGTV